MASRWEMRKETTTSLAHRGLAGSAYSWATGQAVARCLEPQSHRPPVANGWQAAQRRTQNEETPADRPASGPRHGGH